VNSAEVGGGAGRSGVWAEGIGGDLGRSVVRREILCVDEPVCVGTAEGDLGLGWCGTAAGRWEEARACAAQMGDDVIDDCVVGDEAYDTQFARACGTGERFYLQHSAQ
jgi:hypothetical protein